MTSKDFYLSQAWLSEIGAMLKDARISRGMTQAELANAAGVHQPYIARIETGEYDLKVTTLGLLCSALGMTIDIRQPKGYRNKTVNNNKRQKAMQNKNILFATDADAREYFNSSFGGCTLVDSKWGADSRDCTHDRSMDYIGCVDGVTSAYEVIDADGENVATLAYWYEAGEYKIEVDGQVTMTLENSYIDKAIHEAKKIAKKIDSESDEWGVNPEVYVISPDGERIRWDE